MDGHNCCFSSLTALTLMTSCAGPPAPYVCDFEWSATDQKMPFQPDFAEIAHSGGIVTLRVWTQEGRRAFQVSYQNSRPNRSVLLEICASYEGDRVAPLAFNEPPPPGFAQVHIASDSEGRFGHQCPACNRYWRSDAWPTNCPYCRLRAHGLEFFTDAQKRYVQQYCKKLCEALDAPEDGDHIIDMDAVADSVGSAAAKPSFYYAEESQQNKFDCPACGAFNDILGTFGYCASCATRNDLQELEAKTIPRFAIVSIPAGPTKPVSRMLWRPSIP